MPRSTNPAGAAGATAEAPKRVLPTSLPPREMHTADTPEPALKSKDLALDAELDHGDTQIALPETHIDKQYLAELAFMEEPVAVRIEPTQEENAAMTVDCYCQGKGAEVLRMDAQTRFIREGRQPAQKDWLELNFLPVGIVCVTKRKYVEILARSKQMRIRTPNHDDGRNVDNNTVTRNHSRSHVFSVIKDSPKGIDWLSAILNEAF